MITETRTRNVLKNSTATLIEKFVRIFTQFAIRTAFIYFLGKEYAGISSLFTDILQVLSLMELGLDSSMIYSLYKPLAENNIEKISALLHFYRIAFIFISAFVLVAGGLCIPFLSYIVKDWPETNENINLIFGLYILTSSSSYLLIYKSVLLRADQKSRIISKIDIIVVSVECTIELFVLWRFRCFIVYLVIHFFATIARNIAISIVTTNKYNDIFNTNGYELSKEEKRELYRNLACITIYNLSGVIINSTDSVFISGYVGTIEVAIIGKYTLIINSLRTVTNQIVNASKPSIGNLAATSSREKQLIVFNSMNFLSFWITCIVCTCLFTSLVPFVGELWFDASYKVSTKIITILVINYFIAIMVFPVESFRTANGLFIEGWFRPAIMAGLNIILDILWGKRWGVLGIFFATTVSRVLTQVWFDPYLIFKHAFNGQVHVYYIKYIYYFITTVLSCLSASFICSTILFENVLLSFILRLLISFCIPNILVIIFYKNSNEFTRTISLLNTIINKKHAYK